jgi:hypothetical protein
LWVLSVGDRELEFGREFWASIPNRRSQSLINCELFLAIFHLKASYVEVQNLQAIHQEQELHQKRHL